MLSRTKSNMLLISLSVIVASLAFFLMQNNVEISTKYVFVVSVFLLIAFLLGSMKLTFVYRSEEKRQHLRNLSDFKWDLERLREDYKSMRKHKEDEIRQLKLTHAGTEKALRDTVEQLGIILNGRVAYPVGTPVVKPEGYAYPGEVRGIVVTSEGKVRYVVELMTKETSGMLHIFNENQIATPAEVAILKEIEATMA